MSLKQALLNNLTGRLGDLARTVAGFERSGVPLVSWDERGFAAAGTADDVGLYYFVPALMRFLGIDLADAAMLFLGGMIAVSFASGAAGIYMLHRRRPSYLWIATLGALLVATVAAWNVYSVLSCAVVALVPWVIYLAPRAGKGRVAPAFLVVAGAVCAVANAIRVHAGTAVVVFTIVALVMSAALRFRRKALLLAWMAAGYLVVAGSFAGVIHRRDAFLREHQPEAVASRGHVFWHAVYFGFSYLGSPYDLPTTDGMVQAAVQRVAPGTPDFSEAYERVVRDLTVDFALAHPYFVLRTLFSKAGVLAMYFLIFANVGLVAGRRLPRRLTAAFVAAAGFSALPGLLVTPYHFYMLGFMAFAALYGMVRRLPD